MTVTAPRMPVTSPALLLRLEGLAVFAGAIALYANRGGGGLLFLALLLVPDLAATGYLINTRVGAMTYNIVHTYALPAVLMAFAVGDGQPLAVNLALIWFAHIGMDRMMGFGLKYPTVFKDTHLGRV
jgi:hypothetical protein